MTRRLSLVRTLGVWMAVGVLGGLCGAIALEGLAPLERFTIDRRFHVRGRQSASKDVMIVAFDNQTLRTLNLRPPVPREIQARVIDRLDLAGARVIAFDYSLEQPSGNPQADRRIVEALMNARHAVVDVVAPARDGSVAELAGFLPFSETGVAPGDATLQLDPDGVVRRFRQPPGHLQSLAVAAAEAFTGRNHIPVPRSALIDYRGPAGTVPQLSYISVLKGEFPAAAVRGRIVVIGPTATVLADTHHVPLDSAMSGPEIHANAITTALDGFPLRYVSRSAAHLIAFLLGPLVVLLVLMVSLVAQRARSSRRGGVLLQTPAPVCVAAVGGVAFLGWIIATQIAFDHGSVLPLAGGALSVVATSALALILAFELSRRERRSVRSQFAAASVPVWQRVLASVGRPHAVTASDIISGYTLEDERLGEGGMGVVWSAKQARLDRSVAIKVIRAEYARSARYRHRFVAEAYRAAAITHPNVIPVIDAGESGGVLYIVMVKIVGVDLKLTIRGWGRLDAGLAVALLDPIARALDHAFAHHDGLLHRDVKPSNVLIPEADPLHPYLLDFGLAMSTAEAARRSPLDGSLPYLAPERWTGGEGRPADIYALTATLYECVTGLPPFHSASASELRQAHQSWPRPVPTDSRPDLPVALNAVIATGMATQPADRYASANALIQAARDAIGQTAERDGVTFPRTTAFAMDGAGGSRSGFGGSGKVVLESDATTSASELP